MERRSDTHSPRVDDALTRDTASVVQGGPTESRAGEHREQEGPAEGEPTPDARVRGGRDDAATGALSGDEREARTDLARHLNPSVFPASREQLIADAAGNHAPDHLVNALSRLPAGTFSHFEAVWEALGGREDVRGG